MTKIIYRLYVWLAIRSKPKKRKRHELKIEVKTRNEETGDIEVAGFLNQIEVAYLLQFAINALMSMGAEIELQESAEDEEGKEISRIKMPKGTVLQWGI